MVAYTYNGDLYVHESPSTSQIGKDNRVQISRSTTGMISIVGAANADGTTTLIGNGFNSNFSRFKNFSGNLIRNIHITTGGGNDVVEMMPNSFNTNNAVYQNNVTIDTSGPSARDADKVYLDQAIYAKNLTVITGRGDDLVDMQRNLIRGSVSIDTGAGADVVIAKTSEWLGEQNMIRTWTQPSETDRDTVLLEDVSAPKSTVLTGGGDDSITLRRYQLNPFYLHTNGFLGIDAGAGHDTVSLEKVAVDDVYASLGAGNDVLNISGVKTKTGVKIDGGSEWDQVFRPEFALNGENAVNLDFSRGVEEYKSWRIRFPRMN